MNTIVLVHTARRLGFRGFSTHRVIPWLAGLIGLAILIVQPARAQERPFRELVGNLPVGEVASQGPLTIPYITWGADLVTFHANGGLTTQPTSLFGRQGLNLRLTPGDDFVQQVRDYRAGKSPFLRGTVHMLGLASEVIGSDPRTKGVVILQLSWSAGDHLVARQSLHSAGELRGKTIALQSGGPHVGLLDDILHSVKLGWNDITVVWTRDLTGSSETPAELLRKRPDIDAAFAISPDMAGLTGGLRETGTGAEGTIRGAHVLVSTAELSRSIADVYVVRKDYYEAHKDAVVQFVAGYLKAAEEVQDFRQRHDTTNHPAYRALLQQAQSIYGKSALPTLEDAAGLLADATLVGYPGNVSFFNEAGNLSGFAALQKAALDLATSRGYASERMAWFPSGLDYNAAAFKNLRKPVELSRTGRFRAEAIRDEIESLNAGAALDERTIVSFTIHFEPNQNSFSAEQYGAEFRRVVELADKYGNAVVAIRGHADPTKTLLDLVKTGLTKGILKRTGAAGNYAYSLNGEPLDLRATTKLSKLITDGAFDGAGEFNPRETMQAALNLSRQRAEAVRDSIVEYARTKGLVFDKTQIQPVGVGIREPFVAKPTTPDEARQNMRVEFRLVRVNAEMTKTAEFDF